jgi:predicted PurR-regulated permease PerM
MSMQEPVKWLGLALVGLVLWVARGVLPPFVIAAVLAYILSPLVDELARRVRIRRPFAVAAVMILLIGVIGVGIALLGARTAAEVRGLTAQGPDFVETALTKVTGGTDLSVFGQDVTAHELALRVNRMVEAEIGEPAGAIRAVQEGVDAALNTLLCLLAMTYLLADGHRLGGFLLRLVPVERRRTITTVGGEVHQVLGRYLRGQMALIGIMALVTFAVLEWAYHLPYALPIALMTGFLEIIPLVGPVAAGAVASVVAFTAGGPTEAGAMAATYFVMRQVEDQLVMPFIVGRAVHVHPLATIFAVLVGEKVAGVLGMLLAVPFTAALRVVMDFAYPPLPGEVGVGHAHHGRHVPVAESGEPIASAST